jgi:flagellar hook-length control protein FliK
MRFAAMRLIHPHRRVSVMSDTVLNNLLRTPGASNPNPRTHTGVSAEAPAKPFSRTLEQRMNADRPSPRSGRESPPERAERPQPASGRDRGDAPAERTNTGRASESGPGQASESGPDRAAKADSTSGTSAAEAPDPSARPAETDAPPESPPSAAPANLAAIIAAIAAPSAGAAATATEDGANAEAILPDAGSRKRGSTLLENLLGEGGRQTTKNGEPTTGDDAAPVAADKSPKAILARAEPLVSQLQARGNSQYSGVPGAALHAIQPDAPGASHTAFAAALRADTQPVPQLPIPTPVTHRAWAEDAGNRLVWMVGRNESKAELVLTPPHLGKLEVSIHVNGDQTIAHFVAATSAARDALEQAMPRLREVLQQAGISLGQTNVSTSGEQQARHEQAAQNAGGARTLVAGSAEADALASALAPAGWSRASLGMVDTFA